uniref:Uncharacterized protein n=1 Tax=Oryza meridionalis TaxID=40149 RepID=A0A0E0ES98_9ORYZ
MCTTSSRCRTRSAQRCRPEASGASKTRTCAAATSRTSTYACTALAYFLAEPSRYLRMCTALAFTVGCSSGPTTSTGLTTTRSTPRSSAALHASCSATALPIRDRSSRTRRRPRRGRGWDPW